MSSPGKEFCLVFTDTGSETIPVTFLIDGNMGYKINNILTLSLAVKNITNTEYMGRPGDIQPQRNFSLRLAGKF